MPLILERPHVLDVYAEAAARKWVIPTFNSENLTCTEAILTAARQHGESIGSASIPVCIGITNRYPERPQSTFYTHTRRWDIGLQLFLHDLGVLMQRGSPFSDLQILIHLDHVQWDADAELLEWDMRQFSSIMYDASTLPLAQNMARTGSFFEKHRREIVVEGACDEIGAGNQLTSPDMAERYHGETGVDLIVANLGTEHRASAASLAYRGDLAREIAARIGARLCLHGTSSVTQEAVRNLFHDGIRKVNIWTALERDSALPLFASMLHNAARTVGPTESAQLQAAGLLGPAADVTSPRSIEHFTTTGRQQVVFDAMVQIVRRFLNIWLV